MFCCYNNFFKHNRIEWICTKYEHKDCFRFGVTLDLYRNTGILNKFVATNKRMPRDRLQRILRNDRPTGSRNQGIPLERLLDV